MGWTRETQRKNKRCRLVEGEAGERVRGSELTQDVESGAWKEEDAINPPTQGEASNCMDIGQVEIQ